MYCRLFWAVVIVLVGALTPAWSEDPRSEANDAAERAEELFEQSTALLVQGNPQAALAAMSNSLEIAPDAHRYAMRGALLKKLGEYENARADYNRAIELDPKLALAYLLRGTLQSELEDVNRAIADLTVAAELDPTEPTAFITRANVWRTLSCFELALRDLDRAIRLAPKAEAYALRADCWHQLGNDELAGSDWDRAIESKPQSPGLFVHRGDWFASRGKFAQAKADFERAVQLSPDSVEVNNNLAMFLAKCPDRTLRDDARAVRIATRCCEQTGWQNFGLLSALATVHAQAGHFAEAIKWQTEGLRLAPQHHQADLQHRLKLYQAGQPPYPLGEEGSGSANR